MKQFIFLLIFSPVFIYAQFGNRNLPPESWTRDVKYVAITSKEVLADPNEIHKLKAIEHASYICATAIPAQIKFSDFSLVEILPNNDKVYRLLIKSPGALGMMLMFENFKLDKGAKLWIYNKEKTHFAGMYSEKDNYQTNGEFLSSEVLGNEVIVEYLEPSQMHTVDFSITKVYHYFRGLKSGNGNGFDSSGSCMVNAACPEGAIKSAARAATCRIRVTGPSFSGFCSGTLISNTSGDGTPYIISANHCSAKSSLSDLINWEFDFLFESPSCNNPPIEPSALTYKGCTAPAYSGTDNGENSSDFLLLKLNSNLLTSTHDFTFLGWDRSDNNYENTVCYHHPKGDIKKVSTSSGFTSKVSYGNNVPNTHLALTWTPTAKGYSVTEEGSSGSGLVNNDGLLVGTLTGGSASCDNLSGVDMYGRFFVHWDKFGTANDRRLKPWLDPGNTGATISKSLKLSGAIIGISSHQMEEHLNYSLNLNQLKINWIKRGYDINIYNFLGQKVYQACTNSEELNVDFASFTKGIYIVEALNENKRAVMKISW